MHRYCQYMIISSLCVLVLASCLNTKTQNGKMTRDKWLQSRQDLETRLHEYINYKKQRALKSIYLMTTPDYRENVDFETFKDSLFERFPVMINYYIEGIEIHDKNHATTWVTEFARSPVAPTTMLMKNKERKWVRVDGVWYRQPPEQKPDVPAMDICGTSHKSKSSTKPKTEKNENICGI